MLCPLFFNIFINDFIYIIEQSGVCNFADENIIFSCGDSIEVVVPSVEEDMSRSMFWFRTNEMVVNAWKFQVILLGSNFSENVVLEVGRCSNDAADSVTQLEVKIDSKLKFNQHVSKIFSKGNTKINAFPRVSDYLDENNHLSSTTRL